MKKMEAKPVTIGNEKALSGNALHHSSTPSSGLVALSGKLFWQVLCYLLLSAIATQAQPIILPTSGQAPTQTTCTGTILDPGGNNDYPDSANAFLVLSAPLSGMTVQLTFESFNTELNYDFVRLYNGPDISSPLIGGYSGTTLPNGGSPIASTGQHLTLRFTSDASITAPGFVAHWQMVGGAVPPVALFVPSDTNPALGLPITFLNNSANATHYLWDFGDGNTSTDTNPTHSYLLPGTYTVLLTAYNCAGLQNVYSLAISTQSAGALTYLPAAFNITLAQGDSVIVPLTISNTGAGLLTYSLEGAPLQATKRLKVLALVNEADVPQEYAFTLQAINAFYTDYILTEITTYDASALQNALVGKDVLLIPEQENCSTANATAFTAFAPILQSFVENGGTVVVNGTNQSACLFNLGLFSGAYQNFYVGNLTQSLPADPLMTGVTNPYAALATTNFYDITNPDAVRVVEYNGYDVVCYRNIGMGKAILIGHDYRFSNPDMQRIQANALKTTPQAQAADGWLYVSGNAGMLTAGQSATIQVEFNSVGMYGSTYTQNITLYTNDPNNPIVVIPCNITITGGTPNIELSTTILTFGATMQGMTEQQTLTITNTGNAQLDVSNISSSHPHFTVSESSFTVSGGGGSHQVQVTFAPTIVQAYDATLTLQTNIGNYTVQLIGTSLGAPVISASPNPVVVNMAVGATQTVPVQIHNTGNANLNYTVQMPTSGNALNILFYTLSIAADDYANLTFLIDDLYQGEYQITETNTNIAAELQTALQGKDLFLVPSLAYSSAGANAFKNFKTVLQDFAARGGMVVFLGSLYQAPLFNSDLLPAAAPLSNLGSNATVLDATHPLTQGIPASVYMDGIVPVAFNEQPDFYPLIAQPQEGASGVVVGYKTIGNGYVVNMGYTYLADYIININMLRNLLNWAGSLKPTSQISFAPTSGVVASGNSATLQLTIDAGNLVGGTYHRQIQIGSNAPGNPMLTLPITLHVTGVPQMQLSASAALNFGEVIIGNTQSLSFNISNTGTDTLHLSGIGATLPQFTPSFTTAAIAPQRSFRFQLHFSPSAVQNYSGSLALPGNSGTVTIPISGIGLGAPNTAVSPTAINVTLQNAATETQNLNISNSGVGNLQFAINQALDTTHIALLGYGSYSTDYTGVRKYITSYPGNYTLTEINTIYPEVLAQALVGKHILFVPFQTNFLQNAATLSALTNVIHTFVQNGGSVVYAGLYCADCLAAASTLFGPISVVAAQQPFVNFSYFHFNDTTHPLAAGLPNPVFVDGNTEGLSFAAPDVVKIASNPNNGYPATMLAYRKIGAGMAIYSAATFDDLYEGAVLSMLAQNIIRFSTGAFPSWLSTPFSGVGTVAPANNATVPLTFNSTGLQGGVYQFDLRVNTNQPTMPTTLVPLTLTVLTVPQAAFTAQPQATCDGVVTFTDISSGLPNTWLWDFGDGNTSTLQNPTHTYAQEGVYSVTLQACNSLGCQTANYLNYIDYNTDFCNEPVLMPSNGSTLMLTACNGVLKDSGGNANYGNNHNGTVTIAPPGALYVVLNFNFIQFEACCDGLRIYDGPDTNAPLIGNFKGPNLPNGNGIIASTGGSITLQQYTDFAANAPGFELTWSCVTTINTPIAAFTHQFADACLGVLQFTNTSANFPTAWNWNFGDGSTSTLQNPTHQYAQNGVYSVMLEACNSAGCNTYTAQITVATIGAGTCTYLMPADASLLTLSLCQGTLQDSGGDANYGNNNNGIVTIAPPDALSITLQFTLFDFENTFDGIRIFDGPNSDAPLVGVFTGSNMPFGNGLFTSSSGAVTIEQFTDNSVNRPGFTLNWSCQAITTPVANFTYNITAPCNGQINFTDLSTNYAQQWLWDFGDGTEPSTLQNPQHTYTQNGTYTVTLQACNSAGCNTYTTQITLENVLEINVSIPQYVQVNTPVMFLDNTPGAVYWQWNFGYGQPLSGQISNPVTFYTQTGIYTVALTVSDAEGCTKTYTQNVEVVVNIGVQPNNAPLVEELLQVAPNPTQDWVQVYYPSAGGQTLSLQLTDLAGRVVYTHTQATHHEFSHSISLAHLPAGMYVLKLQTGSQLLTKKIVKQ